MADWGKAINSYREQMNPERRRMVEMLREKNAMGGEPQYGNEVAEEVYKSPMSTSMSLSPKMEVGKKLFGIGRIPPTKTPVRGMAVEKQSERVSLIPGVNKPKTPNMAKTFSALGLGDDFNVDEDYDPEGIEKAIGTFGDDLEGDTEGAVNKAIMPMQSGMKQPTELSDLAKQMMQMEGRMPSEPPKISNVPLSQYSGIMGGFNPQAVNNTGSAAATQQLPIGSGSAQLDSPDKPSLVKLLEMVGFSMSRKDGGQMTY